MISVVVATYNGEKYIIKQLESIKNQTVKVDEVIICDDCSKDATVSIVEDYIQQNNLNGWYVHKNEKNSGYSLNFLNGLSLAKGDYVFLSDQDDLWYENKVERLTNYLNNNPVCLSVSSRYNIIDENDNVIPNTGINFSDQINDGSIKSVTLESQIGTSNIRGCSMCIKKELIEKIEIIKLDDLLGHDWLINVLACLNGENVIINEILFGYRYHGNNTSLSAIGRKNLIGDYEKRIRGIEQSIYAHKYILTNKEKYINITDYDIKNISKQIKFDESRLKFLKTKNLFTFIKLGFKIKNYSKIYGSAKGGIKIYFGDLAYAYHKWTSKVKKILI